MTVSMGEFTVADVLAQLGIPFKTEFKFKELTSPQGTKLPVDFLILVERKLAIIEFNGSQHYHPMDPYNGMSLDIKSTFFNQRQKNERIRRQFVHVSGIPLLCIHYRDYGKVEELIKQFIGHIKADCQKKEVPYGEKSYGYFTKKTRRTSHIYRNAIQAFYPQVEYAAVNVSLPEKLNVTVDENLGYLEVSPGTILWTTVQLNQVLDSRKELETQLNDLINQNVDLNDELTLLRQTKEAMKAEIKALKKEISELNAPPPVPMEELLKLKDSFTAPEKKKFVVLELSTGKHIHLLKEYEQLKQDNDLKITDELMTMIWEMINTHKMTRDETIEFLDYFGIRLITNTNEKAV